MATKELAFSAKIKNLKEYLRQITCFTQSPPPGTDVANTIKYFTTTLLNILKDAPNIKGEKFYGAKNAKSNMRIAMFPTLSYSGLFEVVCGLLPVVHLVTINQQALMDCLLQLVACITPFLMWDQLTQLPYQVALMLPMAPSSQYAEIVHILCVYLLPNALGRGIEDNSCTTEAISGILMLILQHCSDSKLHSRVIETLLPLRDHLYKDLFTVISYGPPNTKMPAVSLLFHYWPQLQTLLGTHSSITPPYTVVPWSVPICQRVQCINKISRSSATKMCTHPNMCAAECQLPPPAFICVDCYDTHCMRSYDDSFMDIVLPAEHISTSCNSKTCTSPDRRAMAVCSSLDCVKMNRFRPMSLCMACHTSRHPRSCGYVQLSIDNIWTLETETQAYVVDAIVNLLREAEPNTKTLVDAALQPIMDNTMIDFMATRDPINSRYGILMLKELCQPLPHLSVNSLGRLLGILFYWFKCTGCTNRPATTETLEKLKTEYMTEWLQDVKKSHYEVILSTLLPHPPDFAKVGGQWERLSGRTDQLKEGLEKLIMLGPYDIVTYEVWDYIMPYWLESIRTELSLKERDEIKFLLKQTFDIEMSPLPFLLDKMYHFIDERFESADQQIQEQGLQWLQILTSVDVPVPFISLLSMFRTGTTSLLKNNDHTLSCGERSNIEVKLNCFILMIDILLVQKGFSKIMPHAGVTQNKSKEMFILLNDMITCVGPIRHAGGCGKGGDDCRIGGDSYGQGGDHSGRGGDSSGRGGDECDICKRLTVFYQLVFNLLGTICPLLESSLPVVDVKQLSAKNTQTVEAGDGVATDAPLPPLPPLPPLHSLFVSLLQVLETDEDLDICYYVVNSLKILFVHGQCLNLVYKTHAKDVEGFLHQQFIPKLWKMLNSKQSRTSKIAVTMLFHAVALGKGHSYFWSIVNGDCLHSNWKVRFAAVDKIRMIWESSNANFLSKNQLVMTELAHVFCQYAALLHDSDHNVAQRALLHLKLLGEVALQAVIRCMAVQFDAVAKDRQVILQKLSVLQNVMPDREVFSWPFFLARLQQLFVQAELSEKGTESASVRGSIIKIGTDQNLDQMVKIAQFAALRCDSVSSIRDHSGVYEKSTVSMACSISNMHRERRFTAGPQFMRHKGKKKSSTHSDGSMQDDVMPEVGSEDGKIIKKMWKAMETDKLDHSVLHLLITTIIKYMSVPATKDLTSDEQYTSKQINATLEHMFYLLGYAEGRFFVRPSQLRASPVIDALLCNLPQFLDGNVELGTRFLPDCLQVLRFCGSPQKYASDNQASDYTLIHVPPHLTKYWVQSLLIILYKYNYSNNTELSPSIHYLVQIVINTLSSIPHSCQRRGRDTDSICEVQGIIQGKNDSNSSPDNGEEGGAVSSSASSSTEGPKHKSGAGLLSGAASIIHEEDELEPLSISRCSTIDRTDVPLRLVSKAASAAGGKEAANHVSVSPKSMHSPKRRSHSGKSKKKNGGRLPRQGGIDQASPVKSDRKLHHWKTVDSTKSDELLMASLENPQQSSTPPSVRSATVDIAAVDTAAERPPVMDTESGKSVSVRAKLSAATDGETKRDPATTFGSMLIKMGRKHNSKSDMFDSLGSGSLGSSLEEAQTAMFRSAVAATDFMSTRTKRGQPYNAAGKHDSKESSVHVKQSTTVLTQSSSARRVSCPECMMPIDSYSEEIIVLCIVAIETYLHHDIHQAASMVYEMILGVSRVATLHPYSWQNLERPVFIPGNTTSSALQFLRCTLHYLNPYNIMCALLLSSENSHMFSTIVTALTDFPELTCIQALLTALEGINEKPEIKKLMLLTENLNVYLSSITTDLSTSQDWPKIVDQLDILFRKLSLHLPDQPTNLSEVINLMMTILKLPIVTTHKGDKLVETIGKFIAVALQTHTFGLIPLAKLCQLCHRTFSKERDKAILARVLVNELILVLKYKSTLPEANVLTLLEIVCMDCGSTLLPTYITNDIPTQLTSDMIIETGIQEVMKLYLTDAIEFICDLHTLLKVKAHMKSACLHEDTFGGLLKTGIAQIIALEMSSLIQNDAKAAQRIIPWLYTQQSFTQRGPKEFLESIDHVRFLCWLYIGALTHHAVAENVLRTKCQPLPLEDVGSISIMATSIMTGFVEYSTSSVAFMSSLFYGFILCQVWTVYCETLSFEGIGRPSEEETDISQIIYNFWSIVSPTILNMVSHSKVLREMITLHVLSLMETLQECQSSVVVKLSPLWRQLLFINDTKLPINILVRIQALDNWQPSAKKKVNRAILFDWIKKTQFRLAQIEVQSSTAVRFVAI